MSDKIRVVHHGELESGPATAGMLRSQAFSHGNVWLGEIRTSPGVTSGWHHHGEHSTFAYLVSGYARVEFGPGGAEHIEAGPGDFIHVPPHIIHREGNPGTEEQVAVAVRVGSGQSVFNVDGPDET